MRLTATDYAQHIMLEMRRPRSSPPIPTIPTRYVSHLAQRLPRVTNKPPFRAMGETLQLDEEFAGAIFTYALTEMGKRGHQFSLSNVVSVFHEQTGIPLTAESVSGLYIDNWALCPMRVAAPPNMIVKLNKRQWEQALGPLTVSAFCSLFLSGLGDSGKCNHIAQLSNRVCLVLIPLTTFRTQQPVLCDATHQAIHAADRAYRAISDVMASPTLQL